MVNGYTLTILCILRRKNAIFSHKNAVFCLKQAKNGIYTEGV